MKKIPALGPDSIVLVLSSSQNYVQATLSLVKALTRGKVSCVYVTVNKPSSIISRLLVKNKVAKEKVFFVDCASSLVREDTTRVKNAVFVSPRNLSGISIAVNELIKSIPGPKVVLFDSLSTLLIYNSLGSIEKFSHFMTNRFRLAGVQAVLLSVEDDMDQSLLKTLSKFCDEVIRL
ncbi:MAG: hypothetical protein V1834_02215 [Candidatus Micrarchaeota archaeon]